jgi:hypothetical protein
MMPMEQPSSGPAPSMTVSRAPPPVTVVGCYILVTFFFNGWGIIAIIVGYVVICRRSILSATSRNLLNSLLNHDCNDVTNCVLFVPAWL